MRKLHITIILILISLFGRAQYTPQFSQLLKTLEFINPGYNASKPDPSATLIYRNQWTDLTGAPNVYGVNINYPVNKWHTGFGINAVGETRGLTTQSNIALNACVDVKISRSSYITYGLCGGIEMKYIDMERAVYYDNNPELTDDDLNTNNIYAGIGINLFAGNLHLGASMHYSQLDGIYFNSNELFSLYFNGSYLFNLSDTWSLKPSVLYRNYAGYSDFEYGLFVLYKDLIWTGVSHRLNNALIFFADFKLSGFMRIGYSYDLCVSNVTNLNYGSHEIRLEFTIPSKSSKFEKLAF